MLGFFLTTLVTALSLLIVDLAVPGVGIATFTAALAAALSLGVVNGSIKPVVRLLSLPVTFLTLGAFSLVVNGFCFWLASLVVPGFTVHGLIGFILGPVVLSFVSTFLSGYFLNKGLDKKLAAAGNQISSKFSGKPSLNKSEVAAVQSTLEKGKLKSTNPS
jgi:putative membrane protein